MSQHPNSEVPRSHWKFFFCALTLAASLAALGNVNADDQPAKPPDEKRVEVGKSFSPLGSLLAREEGKPWAFVDRLALVHSRDRLVAIPSERAVIVSKNSAVRLTLVGNLPQFTQVPLLE